ncbi:MAG: D-amino-acid transaminase [Sphingomonadaceae bacterium]
MPAVAYVNGRYMALAEAGVSVEDRGFQFADSLYEVIAFLNRRLLDAPGHFERLERGLAELAIAGVPARPVLEQIARRLVARARVADGLLYLQVSRGAARRDHAFPAATPPTLVMTARGYDFAQRARQQRTGVAALTRPDIRWQRCDLKTVALLPAVLAKQAAKEAGAFEAMFVADDGTVTEGGSTNFWMVDGEGRIVTHPADSRILPGIARATLIRLAREAEMTVVERPFTLAEARAAPELFLTSTTAPILPVVRLDAAPVGEGAPGPVATRLAALAWAEIERQTGWTPPSS